MPAPPTDPPLAVILAAGPRDALLVAAAHAAPREVVFALGGRRAAGDATIVRGVELPNRAARAGRFRADPIDFARAEAALRGAGLEWLGFAHSHPGGRRSPSRADLEALWPHCIQVVASAGPGGPGLCAFWLAGGRLLELPLRAPAPESP